MPKVGVPELITLWITGTAYLPVSAGSPGPCERNKPSGVIAARLHRQDVFGRSGRRPHGDLAANAGEQPQDVALDAVIDGDDVELRLGLPPKNFFPRPRRFGPIKTLAGGAPGATR